MPEINIDNDSSSSTSSSSLMAINLTPDERARVLAGTACQAWHEEVARVRRLQSTTSGRFNGLSSSTGPSLISGGRPFETIEPSFGIHGVTSHYATTDKVSVEDGMEFPVIANIYSIL